jgi:two-component system copper resistance phosphate regulon response regulator CusR
LSGKRVCVKRPIAGQTPVINNLNLVAIFDHALESVNPRMKILLVEDEIQTASHLRKGLLENGFAVDVASKSVALTMASRAHYDLLILDARPGSPHISDLRATGRQSRVLLLADRNGVQSHGGAHPADSCLLKPFAFADFLSQVRRLLPWGAGANPMVGCIADLELDLERHRATRAGCRLDVTPKEFLLLSLLMRNAGKVLSRAYIADQVWDINFDSHTNFVDVHIRRLRSKMDDPFSNKLIHTVRGAGYVLEDRRLHDSGRVICVPASV